MTSLPHVLLCVEVDFSGKIVKGISSEGLPPKWFTKNPDTTFEEDLPEMITVLSTALDFSKKIRADTIFEFWVELYEVQDRWAKEENLSLIHI